MSKTEREARGVQVRRRLTDQDHYWRSVPESQVLHSVLDYVARLGGYGYRQNSGAVVSTYKGKKRFIRYGERGASDIVAVVPCPVLFHSRCPSVTLFIECKDETGKQSPEQRDWQANVEAAGGCYVLVRPSNWMRVINEAIGHEA